MPNEAEHRRELAQQLNTVTAGRVDCTLEVTLDANAATTTVIDSRISLQTATPAVPQTAHAAEEIGNGTMWFEPSAGQCVIHHANNAQTDRIFIMALVG